MCSYQNMDLLWFSSQYQVEVPGMQFVVMFDHILIKDLENILRLPSVKLNTFRSKDKKKVILPKLNLHIFILLVYLHFDHC
jgi:hypothetical protein